MFTRFKSLKRQQIQWSRVLRQLAQNIPETMWIDQFCASRKKKNMQFLKVNKKQFNITNNNYEIWIDGKTTNPDHINTFAAKMDTSVYFKNKSLEMFPGNDLVWRFQMTSNLRK